MTKTSLEALFPSEQFDQILLITEDETQQSFPPNTRSCRPDQVLTIDPPDGKWDLVVIRARTLSPDQAQTQQLISRCRDILARRLVILLDNPPDSSTRQQIMGLGLHQLPRNDAVFYHDLYDYKPTPDWLNNRYWANPELWDKYRW